MEMINEIMLRRNSRKCWISNSRSSMDEFQIPDFISLTQESLTFGCTISKIGPSLHNMELKVESDSMGRLTYLSHR